MVNALSSGFAWLINNAERLGGGAPVIGVIQLNRVQSSRRRSVDFAGPVRTGRLHALRRQRTILRDPHRERHQQDDIVIPKLLCRDADPYDRDSRVAVSFDTTASQRNQELGIEPAAASTQRVL